MYPRCFENRQTGGSETDARAWEGPRSSAAATAAVPTDKNDRRFHLVMPYPSFVSLALDFLGAADFFTADFFGAVFVVVVFFAAGFFAAAFVAADFFAAVFALGLAAALLFVAEGFFDAAFFFAGAVFADAFAR